MLWCVMYKYLFNIGRFQAFAVVYLGFRSFEISYLRSPYGTDSLCCNFD
jgi:hypothetical protein